MGDPRARDDFAVSLGLLLGLLLLASGGMLQHASAGQAAPPAAAQTVACNVPPRSTADILALLVPSSDAPPPVVLAPPLPPGEPADPVTVAEISAAVLELEACLNTGDMLRSYALWSDDWFRNLKQTEDLRAELAALATTPPAPRAEGYREAFIGPWHILNLDDRRVLAAVVWFGGEDDLRLDPKHTRILLFVQHDGRWLIDEMFDRVFVPECGHSVKAAVVVGPPPGAALDAPPMSCIEKACESPDSVAPAVTPAASEGIAAPGTPEAETEGSRSPSRC